MGPIQAALYPKPSRQPASSGGGYNAVSARAVSIGTTSATLVASGAFFERSEVIVVEFQNANVYGTFDGSTPSSTNGFQINNGERFTWSNGWASAGKFIAIGTTAATAYCQEGQL